MMWRRGANEQGGVIFQGIHRPSHSHPNPATRVCTTTKPTRWMLQLKRTQAASLQPCVLHPTGFRFGRILMNSITATHHYSSPPRPAGDASASTTVSMLACAAWRPFTFQSSNSSQMRRMSASCSGNPMHPR